MDHRKDRSLDELAHKGNVAQFVSFSPAWAGALEQGYCRIAGFEPNHHFADPESAVVALLARASDGSVNVRSYAPGNPRSREFVYALRSVDEVMANLKRLAAMDLHLIVNETIDINDGGVSGVAQGHVIEFAPDDTPRCVEQPGVTSLPIDMGLTLLETVYGFRPELDSAGARIEFSIHPKPRGWKGTHSLLWEYEEIAEEPASPSVAWPNRFSRHIGDKAYGLIMASLVGLPVPETLVISRRVAPFRFGVPTGSAEIWIRTCPREQEPGLFTTHKGWLDPFRLMADEDPRGDRIASVLCQAAVPARYSGASIVDSDGHLVIEGIEGEGNSFMLGTSGPRALPDAIMADVERTQAQAQARFGPVRTEWVHDGSRVWIVQLHRGQTQSSSQILVPGEAAQWIGFEVARGLEALRELLRSIDDRSGVTLLGDVGMTSHIADLLRKSGVPARVGALADED
jgi:hypothetical protein